MPELTAARVAEICGGRAVGAAGAPARFVVADSRAVDRDTAFAAVRGGHVFIDQALDAGAPFVIGERLPDGASGVVVSDTVRALMTLATVVRGELRAEVIGITGSLGKTLTKDLVAAALSTRYAVHATPRSFNAELGVPLVVLGCPDDAEIVVAELGARHRGEIAELCEIVRPRAGIITGIGVTHIDEFGSRDALARTKSELLSSLPADGVAIVPSNDEYLSLLSRMTEARMRAVGPGASISYRAERIDRDGRTHGVVDVDGTETSVVLPVAGRALFRNVALALAAAIERGISPEDAARAIERARTSSFRMEIVEVEHWTVVNDAYNANPTSVASALHSVRELASGRRLWAVLGYMAELGPLAAEAHTRSGRLAAALGYEGVIVVGDEAADIAEGAGRIAVRVADADDAAAVVRDRAPAGSVVLVKASRVVGLETFPEILQTPAPSSRKV